MPELLPEPPALEPPQTAAQAAELLERSEQMLRRAQEHRRIRKMAAAEAKSLHKRERRKARLMHRNVRPVPLIQDEADGTELHPDVVAEANKLAESIGLPAGCWLLVEDLERLADLAAGLAASAREAAEQWGEWVDAWQSLVVWARQDADREMPAPPRRNLQPVAGGRR
jgi:hypothetical protein